ncbi:MAG: methyltransferase domain-containing protein [Frankia sp.]
MPENRRVADEVGYLLDNRQIEAGARFEALATIFDPSTFRHIDNLGIAPGWACWEVGAGGASVPRWLAGRVGPTGRVLATDLDVSWVRTRDATTGRDAAPPSARAGGATIAAPAGEAFEVRRHDVGADPPPAGPFDLVHARLVLVHVPARAAALASMVSVLRPGGWLLLEDADPALQPLICPDEFGPEQRLANRLRTGFRTLLAQRGADLEYGRTLPRRLREAGLVDVAADAYFPMTAPASNRLEMATTLQIRDQLLAGGLATPDEIESYLASIAAGRLDLATAPMISAWGRRPPPDDRPPTNRAG